MSQQGYVAAPPYSQAQPRLGGYQAGFGAAPAQPLNGLYGGPPQVFSAPPAGRNLPAGLRDPGLMKTWNLSFPEYLFIVIFSI